MLEILPVTCHEDKLPQLESFDPKTMTWLVADLTTKSEIQLRLLGKHGVLPEDAVLRASELWSKIFQELYPSWRVVSHDFLRSQLSEFLKKQEHSFASTPGAAKTLMTYIQQLLPILASEDGDEHLRQWFTENTGSVIRWGHWYELCRDAWQEMQQMKIVTGTWCSGLLVGHPEISNSWPRMIISDLGCQVHAVEASLLKQLSDKTSVKVFQPQNDWTPRYHRTLNAYDVLTGSGFDQSKKLPELPVPSGQDGVFVERYSTMVTEIKAVVSQVRGDLDRGLAADDIAILAPDIELYWPVLHHYLEQEGIGSKKAVVARLQTFSDVEIWLARLRLAMGKVSSHDLERTTFGEDPKLRSLSYDRFRRLFSIVYDEMDLDRWSEIKKKFESQKAESDILLAKDFLIWISSLWPDNDNTDRLARVIKKIYTESPLNLERELASWMDLLENMVAKEEVAIQEGIASGVHCMNIQEAEWVSVRHRYFLGLSADALRSQDSTGLLFSDVQKIHLDLGYTLLWPDKAHLEFDTLWLLSRKCEKTVLNFSATDFAGSILAPSMIWLLTAYKADRDVEELSLPEPTRWDEIQRVPAEEVARFRLWSPDHAKTLETSIRQDLGEDDPEVFAGDLPWTLSASKLEEFFQCPFKFAAAKIFNLSDEPDLDLDIDRMSKGKMLHKLFELLTSEPFQPDRSDEEISEIVDRLPEETKSPLADRRLWASARVYYMDLGRRFLENERRLREEFAQMKTIETELELKGIWNQQERRLEAGEGEGIPFRGFIDRLDTNSDNQYVLVDYKSHDGSQTSHSRWVANHKLQLPLYADAFERGLSKVTPGEVIGAFYYSAKTMNREKGFRMEECSGSLYADNKRSQSHLSREEKKELFETINNSIAEAVEKMQAGHFFAEPEKTEECSSCSWKQICRAEHLNS